MARTILLGDSPLIIKGKEVYEAVYSGVVKQVDLSGRRMTIVGTDESQDRDGDIIVVSGWDLENYRKNPVFLWAHDYRSVPIARAEKIIKRRNPPRLEFQLVYPTQGLYPFADMILELYGEYIINACSVGFIPWEWEDITDEQSQGKQKQRRRIFGRKFLKQELLELSGCAVPANPNALQNSLEAKGVGYSFDEINKWLQGKLTPPAPDKKDDVLEEMSKEAEFEDETSPVMIQVPRDLCSVTEEQEEVQFAKDDFVDGVEKPYPNEHACRLEDPDKYDRFARKNCYRKHNGKCVDYIFGIKDNKSEVQALRYNKEIWTAAEARSHCDSMGGVFEAAREEEVNMSEVEKNIEAKGVCGARDLPLSEEASWDANSAVRRMREWAGGPDKDSIDWNKYKKGFVWRNEEDPENFGSYKLPFADVKGGKLTATWGGVMNAMKAVLGARGGVDVGDDRKACYNFLASYYKKFDKPVPEFSMQSLMLMELEGIEDLLEERLGEILRVLKSLEVSGMGQAQATDHNPEGDEKISSRASQVILGEAFSEKVMSRPLTPTPQYSDISGVINELKNLKTLLTSLKKEV